MPTYISNIPSISPTLTTYYPTNIPTKPQSIVEDMSTTEINIYSNRNVYIENKNNYLYIVIICIVVIIVLIIGVIILFIRNKRKLYTAEFETDKTSGNTMTEMVIKTDMIQSIQVSDDEDLYGKPSVETIGIITPNSNANSMLDINSINNENEGDNINNAKTEEMYDSVQSVQTKGFITDKGEKYEDINDDKTTINTTMGNENIENVDEVMEWLTVKVKLPQYYDLFVKNGLDSIKLITKVNDDKSLIDLGIQLKQHRIIIIKCIQQLNKM
eukprot:31225_1